MPTVREIRKTNEAAASRAQNGGNTKETITKAVTSQSFPLCINSDKGIDNIGDYVAISSNGGKGVGVTKTEDEEGIFTVRSCTNPTPAPSHFQCTTLGDSIVGNDSGNRFDNVVLSLCGAQGEGECNNYQGYLQMYAYEKDINKWNIRGSAIDGVSNNDGASIGFSSAHKLCTINEQQVVTNVMKDLSSIIV